MEYRNFRAAYAGIRFLFEQKSQLVHPGTWQGLDVSNKPEMATFELEDYVFSFPVATEELEYHKSMIGPNLPWADRHFELDRVSGEPLNPGYTWLEWPYAHKANTFRDENGQFNHSYAERYWPKLAGKTDQGEFSGTHFDPEIYAGVIDPSSSNKERDTHKGIRYKYGDLNDVVNRLVKSPYTRDAYLPVWFPEDTGVVHGDRVPCTIGYLFRMRDNKLSVFYDIRSCDFVRHFQDDVYLTVRLLLWVLKKCREKDEKWNTVKPGNFTMHIGSFHIFKNDWKGVFPNARQ